MSGLPLHDLPALWHNCMEKYSRKTAAIYEGQAYSYVEADRKIRSLRKCLEDEFGLAPGQTVVMAMPNCIEFFFSYWAVIHAGGVVVPVNIRLKPEGMAHVIGTSDAEMLIVHKENWPAVSKALPRCPNVRHIISVGFEGARTTPFEPMVEAESDNRPSANVQPGDLAIIMHTSGTTGVPKGAMMTHENLIFNVKNSIIAHGMRHEDVHLLVVPMFHCTALYSMLPGCAYLGSTVVIAPRPDVKEIADLIERHRITTFIGVPTLFYFFVNLHDLDRRDLSSLRYIAYAGSPMPPQTIRRLRLKLPHVELHNFFGLTETLSVTHVLPSIDAADRPDSIGKILPDVGQKILDDDGNEVPAGEVGDLCFHRSNVVSGYWKRPGLLEEAMCGDWFRTGDYALIDEDGYVYLKGRKKDMIIVGGENVYALEVETAILSHPDVLEVAVVGVPATGIRSYLGEIVKAVVVPKEGKELTERDIKQHCSQRLTSYQMPQVIEFRDKLPRNPAGKVLKRELQ